MAYKRVLLKISGEVLAGEKGIGMDNDMIIETCKSIAEVKKSGVEVAVVVGGGNFWRGRTGGSMSRTTADHIGMLATVMNALALADGFRQIGVSAVAETASEMKSFAETYYYDKTIANLKAGKIVIFGGGIGNPYFSTDTTAALRGIEIQADILMKATNVDGIYDKDPNIYPDAVKFDSLTFRESLEKDLKVMDSTAFALCKDNNLPILVFNLEGKGNIAKAVNGEKIGTIVKN